MKSLKTGLIVAGTAGMMLVAAYGNATQVTNAASRPAASPNASETKPPLSLNPPTEIAATPGHSNSSKGGQVVESGPF